MASQLTPRDRPGSSLRPLTRANLPLPMPEARSQTQRGRTRSETSTDPNVAVLHYEDGTPVNQHTTSQLQMPIASRIGAILKTGIAAIHAIAVWSILGSLVLAAVTIAISWPIAERATTAEGIYGSLTSYLMAQSYVAVIIIPTAILALLAIRRPVLRWVGLGSIVLAISLFVICLQIPLQDVDSFSDAFTTRFSE